MEGTKWVDTMKNEEVRTRIKKSRALLEYNTEKKGKLSKFYFEKRIDKVKD